MGETTIQWCNFSFNPWVGCQKVSPGCTNCYAEAYDKRVGGLPKAQRKNPEVPELRWGPKAPRVRTSDANWRKPLAWNKAAEKAGERHRVFCSSLADVFEDRPELAPWREDLFGLIASTRNLDWLLLTKRPENIARLWPETMNEPGGPGVLGCPRPGESGWPNVWLGTTVEDQQRANERIPHLLAVPAAVRFLSCEPLLERVDLSKWLDEDKNGFSCLVDWVIVGGESGPSARPFHLDWARELINECRDAGRGDPRPFVKQLGALPVSHRDSDLWGRVGALHELKPEPPSVFEVELSDPAGGDMAEWPEDLRVREFPK